MALDCGPFYFFSKTALHQCLEMKGLSSWCRDSEMKFSIAELSTWAHQIRISCTHGMIPWSWVTMRSPLRWTYVSTIRLSLMYCKSCWVIECACKEKDVPVCRQSCSYIVHGPATPERNVCELQKSLHNKLVWTLMKTGLGYEFVVGTRTGRGKLTSIG